MAAMKEIPFFEKKQEIETSRERQYEIDFDVITISGRSGTGKTHTGKLLSEMYDIPFIKVGDDFFRKKLREETGEEILGFMERDEKHDKNVDEEQKQLVKDAILNKNPIILEGRLAGLLASEVLREMKATETQRRRVVRILTTAKNDIRFHRIRERTIKDEMEKTGLSREEIKKNPSLNIEEIKNSTIQRERDDLARWKAIHPELRGIDPFNPANKDNKKRPIYSFSQNTSYLSVAEVKHVIHSVLLSGGLVKEIKQPELPQSGVIFKA